MRRRLMAILFSIFLSLAAVLAISSPVAAVDVFRPCNNASTDTAVCNEVSNQNVSSSSGSNPIIATLKTVINLVSLVVGAASVIIIIISGLRMVLAGGDPKAVASARNGVLYALIGIAVTVLAQSIVAFVLNKNL